MTTLMVAVGGLIGVLGRYGLTRLTFHHESLIWMTAGINIAGSFLLGLLMATSWFSRDLREGLGVGLLGGFTTFSTFSAQAVLEVDAGEPRRAVAYLVISVVGGVAAATAGYVLGRRLA
jgi:fluoride exporter